MWGIQSGPRESRVWKEPWARREPRSSRWTNLTWVAPRSMPTEVGMMGRARDVGEFVRPLRYDTGTEARPRDEGCGSRFRQHMAWDKSKRFFYRWRFLVERRCRYKYRWRLGLEKKAALRTQVSA